MMAEPRAVIKSDAGSMMIGLESSTSYKWSSQMFP